MVKGEGAGSRVVKGEGEPKLSQDVYLLTKNQQNQGYWVGISSITIDTLRQLIYNVAINKKNLV